MSDITGPERYKNWLKSEGENFTTRTRAFFKDLFYINDRRENDGIELPPDVVAGRRWNDSLHNIEQQLEVIESNTKETNTFFGALFSGLGQMVAERKAKKKTVL